MRRFAGGVLIVAVLGVVSLPATAAARDSVLPRSVDREVTVPSAGSGSLPLRCPRGAVALHAAAADLPRGVTLMESLPGSNARSWTLRFANRGSSKRVSAVLRCVRVRLPAGMPDVTVAVSSSSRSTTVAARSSARVAIACRPGYIPTGHGISATDDSVATAAVVPSRGGWTFRLENATGSAASVTPRVRCLRRAATGRRFGRRVRLAFDISRSGWTHTVRGGNRSYSNSCARNAFSVSTGVSLDPDARIALRSASPDGDRSGRWWFRNGGRSQPVKSYLLCMALGTRFG